MKQVRLIFESNFRQARLLTNSFIDEALKRSLIFEYQLFQQKKPPTLTTCYLRVEQLMVFYHLWEDVPPKLVLYSWQ